MAEKLEIYKCNLCGNITEVMHGGVGAMQCCGQDMVLLTENIVDAAKEKHVPVIEKIDGGIKVKVGEAAHPMEEKHYIEWIEIIAGNRVCSQFLKPGDKPEAVFKVEADISDIIARAYCNLHGNWKA